MRFINHRINTPAALALVPLGNGIEVDVRYHEDDLVLHHDPFAHHRSEPALLRTLLRQWCDEGRAACGGGGPIILNIKTEGIERACIAMMQDHGITDWFFLDLSMPYSVLFANMAASGQIAGFSPENLAVRFSEHEPVEYALAFAGKARWVWVDCFTRLPLDAPTAQRLRQAGFRLCLVSPELQKHSLDRIAEFRAALHGIDLDAVCTKRPDLWGQTEGVIPCRS